MTDPARTAFVAGVGALGSVPGGVMGAVPVRFRSVSAHAARD